MHRRSYGQFCGLAVALDAIGGRWTMLIVRDLLLGPRRYGDLLKGLPGISTDLLADRLRALESVDAITKRRLPPPASVTVYELTETGRELQPVITHLAKWGARLLPEPGTENYRIDSSWAIQSMTANYQGGLPDGLYEVDLNERNYVIAITGPVATVADGPPRGDPILRIVGPAESFLAVASGRLTLTDADADADADESGLQVDGDGELAARFFTALNLPIAGSEPG